MTNSITLKQRESQLKKEKKRNKKEKEREDYRSAEGQ